VILFVGVPPFQARRRGAHGGGRTAPTPAAPAEVALIVPMRSAHGRAAGLGRADRDPARQGYCRRGPRADSLASSSRSCAMGRCTSRADA